MWYQESLLFSTEKSLLIQLVYGVVLEMEG